MQTDVAGAESHLRAAKSSSPYALDPRVHRDPRGDGGASVNSGEAIRPDSALPPDASTSTGAVEGVDAVGSASRRSMMRYSHLNTLGQLAAGGVAGAVSKTCTAPLARLTILFQVQGMHGPTSRGQPDILKEATRIYREEGFRAFWKGNMVTIVHRLPYSALNFFSYEQYKGYLRKVMDPQEQSQLLGMSTRLIAGGGAGITAASLTYPLDLVRTRLAAQTNVLYYRGIINTLVLIARDEGLKGLYKGMGATLLGVGPNIAINFCVYETLKTAILTHRPDAHNVAVSLGCGSIAGICSSTATFPLDLVRRRMQLEGAAGRARVYNTGIVGTFMNIARKEGLMGLYRGIIPEYYKVVPGVGIAFCTYEFMKRVLRPPKPYE